MHLRSLITVTILVLTTGCATRTGSLYQTSREIYRDPLKAQELTREAAVIIQSDPDQSEKLLREALTADLYHGPAHNNLGVLYLKQGELYEAAHEFE